jgi:hypothetical protein
MPAPAGRRRFPFLLRLALAAALALVAGPVARGADEPATERWYEQLSQGQKVGHIKVVWAPSTWKGRKTVHDTTVFVARSSRDMSGMKDTFESTNTVELERGEDGTLWAQKSVEREAGRLTTEELTWTGSAYEHVIVLAGQEKRVTVPLDEPVAVDAEAFLGSRARAGTLKAGETYSMRSLNLLGKRADVEELEILGTEDVEGEAGKVRCVKLVQRHLESKSESWLWLDSAGALVQLKTDTGSSIRRVTKEKATEMPARPPVFSITSPASPSLERIFSADRTLVDVHLQGDRDRKLPEFPDSPWSRVLSVTGSDDDGWVIKAELKAYDRPDAVGTLPVDAGAFERDLEPTALMPCRHPDLVRTANAVIGGEKDLRKAAYKLARFVYASLTKQSLDVQQGSALEILEERKGDCSEHALLFVALCRAAGIPARRCSGWVCIGSLWGAHAWAEIWTGAWTAADPTTGEVGGGARYLFFGYSDDPKSYPGVVSARISGRIRIVTTRVQEGADDYDLTDESKWTIHDRSAGRYVHVLAGIEARDVPATWVVQMEQDGVAKFRAQGLKATLVAAADQGDFLEEEAGPSLISFAGAPAVLVRSATRRYYRIHSRRRSMVLNVAEGTDEHVKTLERILAPTFTPRPMRADEASVEGPTPPAAPEPPPAPPPTKEMVVGTYALDLQALREQLPEEQLAALEGLEGSVVLADDGTFTAVIAQVAGESRNENKTSGTWELTPKGVRLHVTQRNDAALEETETKDARFADGVLTLSTKTGIDLSFRLAPR